MSWYYNSDNGAVQELDPVSAWADLHSGLGWHGPFNTKQDALNYYSTNAPHNPGWKKPTGWLNNLINGANAIPDEINRAGNDATKAITDPLGKFNIGGWFLRVGEILLGLILVGVGVAKLTGTANMISKAVKVGALA